MNISVRLNKNFTTAYNKMLEDYGEEIAKINGFSDQQLPYTDFISNFSIKLLIVFSKHRIAFSCKSVSVIK